MRPLPGPSPRFLDIVLSPLARLCSPPGFLPLDVVQRDYVREALRWDNALPNTKYCLKVGKRTTGNTGVTWKGKASTIHGLRVRVRVRVRALPNTKYSVHVAACRHKRHHRGVPSLPACVCVDVCVKRFPGGGWGGKAASMCISALCT